MDSSVKSFVKADQDSNDRVVITHLQNMSSILAFNEELRKRDSKSSKCWPKSGIAHVGRVPLLIIKKWEEMGITPGHTPNQFNAVLETYLGGRLKSTRKRL